MSRILRHRALECGLSMDKDGYVSVNELLSLRDFRRLSASETNIREIVETCSKQRFSLKDSDSTEDGKSILKIRANQGHSIADVIDDHSLLEELSLERLMELTSGTGKIYHGTFSKALPSIERHGLCKMGRNHIHFATAYDGSAISGMRRNCEVIIAVDVVKAMEEGCLFFFRSDNGVILCAGEGERGIIVPEFFRTIIHLK